MSKPVTMTLTHHLGQSEAMRRVQSGVESTKSMRLPVAVEYTAWQDNVLDVRVGALGVKCLAKITVLEETVRLDVVLPAVLGFVAQKYLSAVRAKAQILLGPRR